MVMVVKGQQLIVERRSTRRASHHRQFVNELDYEVAFLGASLGIALSRRGSGRDHCFLQFRILCEEHGEWGTLLGRGLSSLYLDDLDALIKEARTWLEANAMKGADGWELPPEVCT